VADESGRQPSVGTDRGDVAKEVMEGLAHWSEAGTPQGAVIKSTLSNIYLDRWITSWLAAI